MNWEDVEMSKAGLSLSEAKIELLKNKEFEKEYLRLKPRYDLIAQIISARIEQQMTQEDMAKKMGTQKSNISRLESGNYNPSLDFLIRVAQSLNKEIVISLK